MHTPEAFCILAWQVRQEKWIIHQHLCVNSTDNFTVLGESYSIRMMAGAGPGSGEGCRHGKLLQFFQAGLFVIENIAEGCPHRTEALCLVPHRVTENIFNFTTRARSCCPEAKLGHKYSKSIHSQLQLAFDMSGWERSWRITARVCELLMSQQRVIRCEKSHQRAQEASPAFTGATVAQDNLTLR